MLIRLRLCFQIQVYLCVSKIRKRGRHNLWIWEERRGVGASDASMSTTGRIISRSALSQALGLPLRKKTRWSILGQRLDSVVGLLVVVELDSEKKNLSHQNFDHTTTVTGVATCINLFEYTFRIKNTELFSLFLFWETTELYSSTGPKWGFHGPWANPPTVLMLAGHWIGPTTTTQCGPLETGEPNAMSNRTLSISPLS